ncbi:MAG: rotamase [Alphaproteobacteria bacterium]|nr:rotamase [Alphaproteobacteria bacterium]NCQ88508.1 rotamase [Alphaproteobacteria bacterium]NCT06051.1 rotamase [Alphaproteobacteria bacterium]
MNKLLLSALVFGCALSAQMSLSFAKDPFSIVAVVNDDAISSADVDARMALMMASSGLMPTEENRQRLLPQVVDTLVEEQIKVQEAQAQNLEVTPEEISQGFETLAAQNKLKPEEFAKVLQSQGIPKSTLMNQIKSQIAWTKVVTDVLRPRIDVTEADVNSQMVRMKETMGKQEYKIGEIFLPVANAEDDGKTKQLGEKIIEEMRNKKVPFEVVAAQFSRAPGAQQTGGMSWVQEGQLPKELEVPFMALNEGDMTAPIRGLSGYHILTLKETRIVNEETIPDEQTMTNKIGLERLDRLQRRHLSDLKASAFIDRRG